MTRFLLVAALLALIAVLVQWRLLGRDALPPQAEAVRPGYYLTGVDLEEFGDDGKLRIGLKSASANEDPATGGVRLSDVRVNYHTAAGQQWQLASNAARVPRASRVVEFEGDVRLSGSPAGSDNRAELHTDRLSLDTEAESAETASAVELAFGRHLMQASGMRADLKAGRLRLESEVNGVFTP